MPARPAGREEASSQETVFHGAKLSAAVAHSRGKGAGRLEGGQLIGIVAALGQPGPRR
jgi:hypothetical protein